MSNLNQIFTSAILKLNNIITAAFTSRIKLKPKSIPPFPGSRDGEFHENSNAVWFNKM